MKTISKKPFVCKWKWDQDELILLTKNLRPWVQIFIFRRIFSTIWYQFALLKFGVMVHMCRSPPLAIVFGSSNPKTCNFQIRISAAPLTGFLECIWQFLVEANLLWQISFKSLTQTLSFTKLLKNPEDLLILHWKIVHNKDLLMFQGVWFSWEQRDAKLF